MLDSIIASQITLSGFLLCTLASVALGLLCALVFSYHNRESATFALSLALLPVTVQLVIMLVNGNLGAGVAVAGAFSLVRFRSAAGSARQIAAIFIAMALGLATGMGYLFYAAAFFAVVAALTFALTKSGFCAGRPAERQLRVTIPEDLDYDGLFDDLFRKYGLEAELERVKTTNMGTLYELTWRLRVPGGDIKKAFLDEIRCRNGNLNVVCGKVDLNPADTL